MSHRQSAAHAFAKSWAETATEHRFSSLCVILVEREDGQYAIVTAGTAAYTPEAVQATLIDLAAAVQNREPDQAYRQRYVRGDQ